MSRFNLEFRIKVVEAYLLGKGSTTLAREYGIGSNSVILDWVHRFERRGIEGLKYRSTNQKYSSQFKIDVLNWRKQNQASLPTTALNFDLSSPSIIWQWERRFKQFGTAGLERKRGNLNIMAKHKRNLSQDNNSSSSVSKDSKEELKQLKKENEMLKIENQFLKKLEALARKKSAQKNSQN